MYVSKGKGGIAWGLYNETRYENGWDELFIITSNSYDDTTQAIAAGFLEGALTHHIIYDAWLSFWNGTMKFFYPVELQQWIEENDLFVRSMSSNVDKNSPELLYWEQVGLTLNQFDGIYQGYIAHAPKHAILTYSEFLLYQYNGDISDINISLNISGVPRDPVSMMFNSHCSTLVKLSQDGSTLWSSHVTWTTFSNLLRVFKHYTLNYQSSKSITVSFSSYAGFLPSGDDYYITDQNLVVMETTNSVMNTSLYRFVTPQTVPYWIRTVVANRMASSGSEWSNIFALFNSGTYNNQWIIVDYKLFQAGKVPLAPNTLWIAEQIPGYVVSGDVTHVINSQLYWPSYNIPYFPFVYDISGYPQCFKKFGNECSYEYAPRANIFRRDQHKVHDLESMKKMMRYNKWQSDPLSLGNACNGISSRCDLNPPSNVIGAFGGIDAKITNNIMTSTLTSSIVSGPTWDSQPPFAWTEEWQTVPHYGHPEVFAFDFITVSPTNI